jgi:hypothetical protein
MNGNFNTMLSRKHSGETVDARGWLIWDADDVSAEITVTIAQNGMTVAAPPFQRTPEDDDWRVDVDAISAQFLRGSASGSATATVTTVNGPEQYYWESPPLTLH